MYPELSMQEKEITRGIPAFPTNAGMMAIVRRLHVESGGPVPVTLISFMQMVKGNKYIDAFRQVLDELGLEYRMTGPFPKHLAKHSQPVD